MANVISIRIEADGSAAIVGMNGVADAGDKMGKTIAGTKDPMDASWTSMAKGVAAGTLLAKAFELLAEKAMQAGQYIKDSTLLAARVETLGVVMRVVGNNAGYTSTEIIKYQQAIAKMGITTQESMSSVVKMSASQMDLSRSTELARIAQNAAVIGGINSSEAFGRMIQGIRSGEVEVLRNIGINVMFEEGYKKTAAALGTTSDKLSTAQKMTSRMNEVLTYGANINGAYEASMTTAGKQMLSMSRITEELSLKFGQIFNPVFTDIVKELNSSLKGLDDGFQRNSASVVAFGSALSSTFQFVKREMLQVSGFLDKVGGTASGVMAALYGPGMMAGNKNSTAQFDKWMAINEDYKKRYEQNRFDLIEADAAMRSGTGNDPGEQAWVTGRNLALETQRINAKAREEEAAAIKKEKYNAFENGHYKLLLKNAAIYDNKIKEQEKSFYDLGQEIKRTGESAAAAFDISTMQLGDLKTDRYKPTPLSQYKLMTNNQYSIPQSGPDLAAEKQAAIDAMAMQSALDREMLAAKQSTEDQRLNIAQMALDVELEQRIAQAEKLKVSEDAKWEIMLQAEQVYISKKDQLQQESAKRQVDTWWNGAQTYIGFAEQMTTMGLQMLMFDESQRSQIGKRMLATSIRFLSQSLQQEMFVEAKKHLFKASSFASQTTMQAAQHTSSLVMLETEAGAWAAFLTALSMNPYGGQAVMPSAAAMTAVAGVAIPAAMAATVAEGAAGAASEYAMAGAWLAGGVLVGALGEAGASAIEGGTSGSRNTAGYGAGTPGSPIVTNSGAAISQSSPTYNIHIYGNVVDHDKFARELIPAITKATADGVR